MSEHTHDAWAIGEHELPTDLPHRPRTQVQNLLLLGNGLGFVLVHDLAADEWEVVDLAAFNGPDGYEWL